MDITRALAEIRLAGGGLRECEGGRARVPHTDRTRPPSLSAGYCASTLPHSARQHAKASPAQSQASHIEQAMSVQDTTAFRHLVTHRLSVCWHRPSKVAPLSEGHTPATRSLAEVQVPSACGAQPGIGARGGGAARRSVQIGCYQTFCGCDLVKGNGP